MKRGRGRIEFASGGGAFLVESVGNLLTHFRRFSSGSRQRFAGTRHPRGVCIFCSHVVTPMEFAQRIGPACGRATCMTIVRNEGRSNQRAPSSDVGRLLRRSPQLFRLRPKAWARRNRYSHATDRTQCWPSACSAQCDRNGARLARRGCRAALQKRNENSADRLPLDESDDAVVECRIVNIRLCAATLYRPCHRGCAPRGLQSLDGNCNQRLRGSDVYGGRLECNRAGCVNPGFHFRQHLLPRGWDGNGLHCNGQRRRRNRTGTPGRNRLRQHGPRAGVSQHRLANQCRHGHGDHNQTDQSRGALRQPIGATHFTQSTAERARPCCRRRPCASSDFV